MSITECCCTNDDELLYIKVSDGHNDFGIRGLCVVLNINIVMKSLLGTIRKVLNDTEETHQEFLFDARAYLICRIM